jgi:putative prophage lp2 protein 26
MRTIKFRGLSIFKGKGWLYGIPSWDFTHLFPTNEDNLDGFSCFECIPETISQFTGQHDKNGTEIYEGDILAHDYGDYSLIVYREECIAFCRIDAKDVGNINGYYNLHEEAWRSCLQRARVIGNQYENPELLDYKKED